MIGVSRLSVKICENATQTLFPNAERVKLRQSVLSSHNSGIGPFCFLLKKLFGETLNVLCCSARIAHQAN